MAVASRITEAREILEFLKSKLEIPEGIVGLTLHLKIDEPIRIECEYLPEKKVIENGQT